MIRVAARAATRHPLERQRLACQRKEGDRLASTHHRLHLDGPRPSVVGVCLLDGQGPTALEHNLRAVKRQLALGRRTDANLGQFDRVGRSRLRQHQSPISAEYLGENSARFIRPFSARYFRHHLPVARFFLGRFFLGRFFRRFLVGRLSRVLLGRLSRVLLGRFPRFVAGRLRLCFRNRFVAGCFRPHRPHRLAGFTRRRRARLRPRRFFGRHLRWQDGSLTRPLGPGHRGHSLIELQGDHYRRDSQHCSQSAQRGAQQQAVSRIPAGSRASRGGRLSGRDLRNGRTQGHAARWWSLLRTQRRRTTAR